MRRIYTIELKIEFNDETRYEQIKAILARAARMVLTAANLIADGRKPAVMVRGEDWLEGINEDVDIMEKSV
jgi:hypothetical protein